VVVPYFLDERFPATHQQSDTTLGMNRTEVLCKKCNGHLGHVFEDGPKEKGGQRYCINSLALKLDRGEK